RPAVCPSGTWRHKRPAPLPGAAWAADAPCPREPRRAGRAPPTPCRSGGPPGWPPSPSGPYYTGSSSRLRPPAPLRAPGGPLFKGRRSINFAGRLREGRVIHHSKTPHSTYRLFCRTVNGRPNSDSVNTRLRGIKRDMCHNLQARRQDEETLRLDTLHGRAVEEHFPVWPVQLDTECHRSPDRENRLGIFVIIQDDYKIA